jgi:Rrf2 family protein
MRISAKADYAVRAVLVLAGRRERDPGPVKIEDVARAGGVPPKFLESILVQLKRGGLVDSKRGADGGYWLARPAEEISVADVLRAIDGPLTLVAGRRPGQVDYPPEVAPLQEVWEQTRAALRGVLDDLTFDQLTPAGQALDFQI